MEELEMVKVFDDLYDAILFLEVEAENYIGSDEYFKSELLLLPDGRWRVGIQFNAQMELNFGK